MKTQTMHLLFDEALLPARILTSGSISCLYEHGRLRYLKFGETEAVRMIYFAVRDADWDTSPYTIEDEIVEQKEDGFSIHYTSVHRLHLVHYKATVSIKAEGNNVSFSVKGEALTAFQRNRIGICVLHPIKECSGQKVVVTKPDGSVYTSSFPIHIGPHQPFKNIKKMVCEMEQVKAEFVFDGDLFETEDQRNWADASYKTYSTPLDLPFPVAIEKGATLEQSVTIHLSGALPKVQKEQGQETKIPFPKIGYERNNSEPLIEEEYRLLQALPFHHYRLPISLSEENWQQQLSDAVAEATILHTKLELVLFFDEAYQQQLPLLLSQFQNNASLIDSLLVLHQKQKTTPADLLSFVYNAVKEIAPEIKIGFGTDGFFAELNRNRPTDIPFDFVSFSLNPQVHAADTRSLIENLERQADLIETARSFASDKPVHVAPLTFKIRSASSSEQHDLDPRQHSSFGAFWTLTALKNLGGADQVTLFQTKGYRGLLRKDPDGKLSPLYEVLKAIKQFQPKWFIDRLSSKPFADPLILENKAGDRLQVDNNEP